MPNGGYGEVQTEYDRYCDELHWLHRALDDNCTIEYKIYRCCKGILMVLER